ncbi:MAG: hypothetical protein U9M97_04330 [Candidatus Hadarchaeota archaeon]|nr:hypothetical protein [Candidatus Hadarchaeota archaeon]
MMNNSVWEAYFEIYNRFSKGPVSAQDIVAHTHLSEPMCRKVIWTLKNKGLLEKVGRENRQAKFEVVPPTEGAVRLVLSHLDVRYRHGLDFFKELQTQGLDYYLVGTTALNYYAACYAPVLELACKNVSGARKVARRYYIRAQIGDRIPSEFEKAELEGIRFKVASVEDAIIQSYAHYPDTLIDRPTLDYMTAIALRVRGRSLKTGRFRKLPPRARKHLKRILGALDLERDLRRAQPRDVIEEEARRVILTDATTNARKLVETLSLMGAAVWPRS